MSQKLHIAVTVTDGVIDADVFKTKGPALRFVAAHMSELLKRDVDDAELADGWEEGELADEIEENATSFDAAIIETMML